MEKLRRALKIYWTEHGTPILFWSIVIIAIIAIVQALNYYTIQQNSRKNSTLQKNTSYQQIFKEDKTNTELVNQFLQYCTDKQIEMAYELLSENCKKELYPSIKDFSNLYYNKLFNSKHDIEVKYDSKRNIYQIIFYEDILESGKIENRGTKISECEIQEGVVENKLYITIK